MDHEDIDVTDGRAQHSNKSWCIIFNIQHKAVHVQAIAVQVSTAVYLEQWVDFKAAIIDFWPLGGSWTSCKHNTDIIT